jgi:hypothetical protein
MEGLIKRRSAPAPSWSRGTVASAQLEILNGYIIAAVRMP